jgi:hypothetical protein
MPIMKTRMVAGDGESGWPEMLIKCQRGTMGSMRAFLAVGLFFVGSMSKAFLEFVIRFAKIVKQADESGLIRAAKMLTETGCSPGNLTKVFCEWLPRMGQDRV